MSFWGENWRKTSFDWIFVLHIKYNEMPQGSHLYSNLRHFVCGKNM
eukprot:UN23943